MGKLYKFEKKWKPYEFDERVNYREQNVDGCSNCMWGFWKECGGGKALMCSQTLVKLKDGTYAGAWVYPTNICDIWSKEKEHGN